MEENIWIKHKNTVFSLNAKYHLLRPEPEEGLQIVIPAANFEIRVLVNLRPCQTASLGDSNKILEILAESFSKGQYWQCNNLELECRRDYNIAQTSVLCLTFTVQCRIFDSIRQDLSRADGELNTINVLRDMELTFNADALADELDYCSLLEGFNYMMASYLLNLEFRLPLIFSIPARQTFRVNYSHLIRMLDEFQLQHDLVKCLENLNRTAVYEHTTLKAMICWRKRAGRGKKESTSLNVFNYSAITDLVDSQSVDISEFISS